MPRVLQEMMQDPNYLGPGGKCWVDGTRTVCEVPVLVPVKVESLSYSAFWGSLAGIVLATLMLMAGLDRWGARRLRWRKAGIQYLAPGSIKTRMLHPTPIPERELG